MEVWVGMMVLALILNFNIIAQLIKSQGTLVVAKDHQNPVPLKCILTNSPTPIPLIKLKHSKT